MSIYIKIQICKQLYVILYVIPDIIIIMFNRGEEKEKEQYIRISLSMHHDSFNGLCLFALFPRYVSLIV